MHYGKVTDKMMRSCGGPGGAASAPHAAVLYKTREFPMCTSFNLALSSPLGSMPSLCPPVHMKIECVEKEAVY